MQDAHIRNIRNLAGAGFCLILAIKLGGRVRIADPREREPVCLSSTPSTAYRFTPGAYWMTT
jgi:hypothetical protein